MSRKTIWKSFSFTDPNEFYRLQASFPGLGEAKKYHTELENWQLETNMPYSSLRAWFRHSDVPMRDHVTDTMPLAERVKQWEEKEENDTASRPSN